MFSIPPSLFSPCMCVFRGKKGAKELKVTVKEVVRFKGSVLKVSLCSEYMSAIEKCIYI